MPLKVGVKSQVTQEGVDSSETLLPSFPLSPCTCPTGSLGSQKRGQAPSSSAGPRGRHNKTDPAGAMWALCWGPACAPAWGAQSRWTSGFGGLRVSLQRLLKVKLTCRPTAVRIDLFKTDKENRKSSWKKSLATGFHFATVQVLGIAKHWRWRSSSLGPPTLAALLLSPSSPRDTRGSRVSLCRALCGTWQRR